MNRKAPLPKDSLTILVVNIDHDIERAWPQSLALETGLVCPECHVERHVTLFRKQVPVLIYTLGADLA